MTHYLKAQLFLSVVSLLFALGCESTPPKVSISCESFDWFDKGRQDGLLGRSFLPNSSPTCAPNSDQQLAYSTGYSRGLVIYCQPENGLAMGRTGQTPRDICPDDLRPRFQEHYAQGLEIFRLRKERDLVKGQIDNLFGLLTVQTLSRIERKTLNDQLRSLENRQVRIDEELSSLITR